MPEQSDASKQPGLPTDPAGASSDGQPAPNLMPEEAMLDLGDLGDMGGLLQAAVQMQQQFLEAQQEAASTVVEGAAGGGAVRIEVTGGMEFRGVHIDPAAVDPDDVELLEDLILAALGDAMSKVKALQERAMPNLALPGLGVGGLDFGNVFASGLVGGEEVDALEDGEGGSGHGDGGDQGARGAER
ncbi:MAG: YbaB/EbfC family nucleoid-associated protein [Acidimicrobiales bacterium]|nr:YbaB/EbfC family nucleoid-associated protein [Acidimicrobiales bacterium]